MDTKHWQSQCHPISPKNQIANARTSATIAGATGSRRSAVLPDFVTTIHPKPEVAMSEVTHDPRRRDFLKSGALAVAGSGLLGAGALAEPAKSADVAALQPAAGQVPVRPFGKTGHKLPILGMGGSAMVQIFQRAYGVPLLPLEERVAMVRHAYDSGIRYFDTARVYGESEKIMGRGLKGVREHCYVATKCHVPDPSKVRQTVETSLKELDMDSVDCVQIHSPAIEAIGFDGAMKMHAELVKLRDEKLLKFIGLTTHVAFEEVHQMIKTDGFDQVLLAYGYVKKGMDTMLSSRKVEYRDLCLAAAHERGMAIVAMKVLGANMLSHNAKALVPDYDVDRLAKLPPAAIRWVLQDERVSMLNIGVSMPSDVDRNLAVLRGDTRFTNEDRALLADFSSRLYDAELVKAMRVT
jgi:predicted aldo/keto reductase-like oxidoreductase